MNSNAYVTQKATFHSRNSNSRHARNFASMAGVAIADIFAFIGAWLLFRAGRSVPSLVIFRGPPSNVTAQHPLDVLAILALVFILVRYVAGDYSRRQLFWDSARQICLSLLVLGIPDICFYILAHQAYSLTAVLLTWLFLLFAIPISRLASIFVLTRWGIWQIPTAIFADGGHSRAVVRVIRNSLTLGFDLRWVITDDREMNLPLALTGLPQLRDLGPANAADKLAAAGCGQAVIVTDHNENAPSVDLIQALMEADIRVAIIPSLRRLPLVGLNANHFFGTDILMFQVRNNLRRRPNRFLKRCMDVVGSFVLLVLSLPLFVWVAIAIKLGDGGPIIYSQKRTGMNGKPFPCLKFRTMSVDADQRLARWREENPKLYEEYLRTYKLKDDPRVTKVGKWLRRTSFDELPQILNVFIGQMSLVGPRPVPEDHFRQIYGHAAQFYMRNRPGLTGLWQVSGRSETTLEERIVFDEWYIMNWTLWNDIVIIIRTAWVVLAAGGAY